MYTQSSSLFVHLLKDKGLYSQFCEALYRQSGYGLADLFDMCPPADWVGAAFDWEFTPLGVLGWHRFEAFWLETLKFLHPHG